MRTYVALVLIIAATSIGSVQPLTAQVKDLPLGVKKSDKVDPDSHLQLPQKLQEVNKAKQKAAAAKAKLKKARTADKAEAKKAVDEAQAELKVVEKAVIAFLAASKISANLITSSGGGDNWILRRNTKVVVSGSRWANVLPPLGWTLDSGKICILMIVPDGSKGAMWQVNGKVSDIVSARFQPHGKDGSLEDAVDLVKEDLILQAGKVVRITMPSDAVHGGVFLITVKP